MPGESASRARAIDEEVVSVKRRGVVLPRRWRTRGHDALSLELDFIGCSLIRLSGPMPAHGCAVDIRPQAGGVRMRLHAQDFDALITAPIRGSIIRMEAHRRADGPEPWPLLHL